MNKLKYYINKWFDKKKPNHFEIRKIWIGDKNENVLIPTGYDNPKNNFIVEWLEKGNEEAIQEVMFTKCNAKLLEYYMKFSFDLLCSIKNRGISIQSLDTYEKYVNCFDIKVPGFTKPKLL